MKKILWKLLTFCFSIILMIVAVIGLSISSQAAPGNWIQKGSYEPTTMSILLIIFILIFWIFIKILNHKILEKQLNYNLFELRNDFNKNAKKIALPIILLLIFQFIIGGNLFSITGWLELIRNLDITFHIFAFYFSMLASFLIFIVTCAIILKGKNIVS